MSNFVRFIQGVEATCGYDAQGIFGPAYRLHRAPEDDVAHLADWLVDLLAWFETELPVPPFLRQSFPEMSVCWFKPQARTMLGRMWELVVILREVGIPVRFIFTRQPGRILYEDAYQIVAETPRRRDRRWRL